VPYYVRGSPRQVPVGAFGVSVQGMAGPCDTWRMSGHQCSVACCESAVGRWRHVCGVGRVAWSSGVDTWCDGKVESAAFESERVRCDTMNSQSYCDLDFVGEQARSAQGTTFLPTLLTAKRSCTYELLSFLVCRARRHSWRSRALACERERLMADVAAKRDAAIAAKEAERQ